MTSRSSIHTDIVPILAAISITFILFWMDEGFYDLRWMKSVGNWIMFIIYVGGLVLGELLASRLIFPKETGSKKTVLTIITGIPLGLLLTIIGVFAIGGMVRLLS